MGDSKVKGGIGSGLSSMLVAALVYMVLPVAIALFTLGVINVALADLGSELPAAVDDMIAYMTDMMDQFVFNVILYAIPIVIVAFPYGFFGRGSTLRLLFGMVQVVLIALWLYFITNGGRLLLDFSEITLPFIPEDLPLSVAVGAVLDINLVGVIYLLMLVALAKGAVHLAEYGGYRGRYLRSRYKGRDDEPREEPRRRKRKENDWEYL